jgi:HAD superfamily 5'-nucleotidase-like hydrolase
MAFLASKYTNISDESWLGHVQKVVFATSLACVPLWREDAGAALRADLIRDLDHFQWFGFDLDYTLIEYSLPASDTAAYTAALKPLSNALSIEIPNTELHPIDFGLTTRGLVLDGLTCNVLQIDCHHRICRAYLGSRHLDWKEIRLAYSTGTIDLEEIMEIKGVASERMKPRYTTMHVNSGRFVVPLLTLAVDTVLHLGTSPVDFQGVFKAVIDSCNIALSGKGQISFENVLLGNVKQFCKKQGSVGKMLEVLRSHQKKTFLVTNSDVKHTKALMSYAYGSRWMDLFDVIICKAGKNKGFFENQKLLFEAFDVTTEKPLRDCNSIQPNHKLYCGGNAFKLAEYLVSNQAGKKQVVLPAADTSPAVQHPILYFGDHYIDDIKSCSRIGWKAAWICPELFDEYPGEGNFHPPPSIVGNKFLPFLRCSQSPIVSLLPSNAFAEATQSAYMCIPSLDWLSCNLDKDLKVQKC